MDRTQTNKAAEQGKNAPARRFRPTPITLALCIYVLLLLARLLDASVLTRDNEYFGIIVLQIVIFLIPAFAYLRLRGKVVRNRLRLSPPRLDQLLLLVGAILALSGGGMLLQLLLGGTDGSFTLYDTFISKSYGTTSNTLYLILAYAVLPAFCEELVFRGIFLAEYEKHGAGCAALMSMLFFTMLHFDLRNIPLYLFSALVLCIVLYAARSLYAAMLVHFVYNLFCLFGVPYVTAVYASMGRVWILIFLLIVMLLFGAALFCGEAARLYRHFATHGSHEGEGANPTISHRDSAIRFLRRLLTPQAAICILLYLTVAIAGMLR